MRRVGLRRQAALLLGIASVRPALWVVLVVLNTTGCHMRDPYLEVPEDEKLTISGDPLEEYRRDLLGPDRKADGSQDQRTAIEALVRGGLPKAHEVLREVLLASTTNKISRSTVMRVLERLTDHLSLDLKIRRKDMYDLRMGFYEGYIPTFVHLIASNPPDDTQLRETIFNFFAYLPPEVSRNRLKALLSTERGQSLRAVIEVAGQSRDPGIAKSIAPHLQNPELRPLVQVALQRLTLQAQPFETVEQFRVWDKENGRKDFDQLALIGAYKGLEVEREYVKNTRALKAKQRAKVRELVAQTISLTRMQTPPPWKAYQALLDDPDLRLDATWIVEQLYQALRNRELTPGDLESSISELQKLHKRIETGYMKATQAERKSWISAYTLTANFVGGSEPAKAEAQLLATLGTDPDLDDRVIELMTMFPSFKVRGRVLAHLKKALRSGALDQIDSGIRVIGQLGLSKEKSLAQDTLDFLDACVRHPKLERRARERAIEVLGGFDHDSVVKILRSIVLRGLGELPESLRLKALAWVNTVVARRLQAAAGHAVFKQALDQLQFLVTCLADDSSRLRHDSAKELENFPPSPASFKETERRKIALEIVSEIGRTLRRETDSIAVSKYREVLWRQATAADVAWDAVQVIAIAFDTWARDERDPSPGRQLLKNHVAEFDETLTQLLRADGFTDQEAGLLNLADKLLRASLPNEALILLGAKALDELENNMASNSGPNFETKRQQRAKNRLRRADLLYRTAKALDIDELSHADRRRADRTLVRAAKAMQLLTDTQPAALVLLGEAFLNEQNPQEADIVLTHFLDGPGRESAGTLRNKAKRLRAHALALTGNPATAAKLLDGLRDFDSRFLRAECLRKDKQFASAEALYRELDMDPSLARTGAQREQVLLGVAESLLGQNKVAAFDRWMQALPIAPKSPMTKERWDLLAQRRKAMGPQASPPGNGK